MAPRSATEEMAALAVETSDTTATEAEAAPRAPQNRSRALRLVGAAGAAGAAALAAGAVVAVVAGHAAPFSLQQAGGGGVTALQQSRNFKVGTGCTNWMMKFQEAQLCSADECWDLCATTAGCKAMNFQGIDNDFCGEGGGKAEGTCYLFGEDCQETDNACWTLGIMPATGGTVGATGGSGGVAGGAGGATGGTVGATGGTGGATGGSGGVAGGTGGATGGAGVPDTAGDKTVVNFKLAGLDFASFNKDGEAYRAVFNGVKEALAKSALVKPENVIVAFAEAPDVNGSVAVTATFLNPRVQVGSVEAFLPQAGQEIVNALSSNQDVMNLTPGNLAMQGASVGKALASEGGSLQPQEMLPPPTDSQPPVVAPATTTADNSLADTTV